MNTVLLASFLLMISSSAHATVAPLALVWKGPGTCKPSCAKAAGNIAKRAGFRVQYISPGFQDFSVFQTAKLWMQPGGVSVTAAESMGKALVDRVREFVSDGGGYVGFCAGAFLSTGEIGTSEVSGLGIAPGQTELYVQKSPYHRMFKLKTETGDRWMYYAGGPYFKITDAELEAAQGKVIARYPDGSIAGVEAHYGRGKVAAIGLHPEAGFWWKLAQRQVDHDGNDYDFAVNMVKYATSP